MSQQISEGRKFAFNLGGALIAIGVLMFLSVFVSGAMHFGDFSNFEGRARSEMLRGFGGMVLMILGSFVRIVGARGLAGSGVVLDPEKAREELKPYSRMAGGMVKDVLNEADIHLGGTKPERVVMVKCPSCDKLNEQDSKFCQECGKPL